MRRQQPRFALALVLVLGVAIPAALAQSSSRTSFSPFSFLRQNFNSLRSNARQTIDNAVHVVMDTSNRIVENFVKFAVVRSNDDEICYRILGCFSLRSPWISLNRPLPRPRTPDDIDVRYYLYTRDQPERFTVTADPEVSIEGSDFDSTRPTFFIVHGYLNNGNETWMADLKDAVLSKVDGNVFLVDWGRGSREANYLQAASNTRVVGREIAYLARTLIRENGANAEDFHFMGHSLGSHISGYAARNITNVGRITAFDPAGPGFEALSRQVRLSKNAANFVEALHTNAKPCTQLGFGMMHPVAHVDFYLNGGVEQPGCTLPNMVTPKSLIDLVAVPFTAFSDLISCSHIRSYEYFTEAIKNTNCRMWGHKVSTSRNRVMWSRGVPSPVLEVQGECKDGKCVPIGLDAPEYPARGSFSVVTDSSAPYCLKANSGDGQSLRTLRQLGLVN